MSTARTAVVLGSTGYIGAQQVEEIARDGGVHVMAIAAAGNSPETLAFQAVGLGVLGVAVRRGRVNTLTAALQRANEHYAANVRPEILIGPDSLAQAAGAGAHEVINAIAGISGVGASAAALRRGARLGVSNTETLLTLDLLQRDLPEIDLRSQISLINPAYSGITRALHAGEVTRITLTTPSAAIRRRRITPRAINEATGMAVALSFLEISALAQVPVDVVVHDGPVSSIVEARGGRTHLNVAEGANLPAGGQWVYEPAHTPALELAQAAAQAGGTYPLALQLANQHAVAAHLEGMIARGRIVPLVAAVLDLYPNEQLGLNDLEGLERWVHETVARVNERRALT